MFRRLGALFYDSLLLLGILFFATSAWLPFLGGQAVPAKNLGFQIYLLGVIYGFFVWFWVRSGQTLGMRAWKIKVCLTNGQPLNLKAASLRFFAAIPSFGLFGLGLLWAGFDAEGCCWHDRVSGTRLVKTTTVES